MGAGMVGAFALLGLVIGVFGDLVGLDPDHIRVAGAVLMMLLGMVMLVPTLNERFTLWVTPLASGAQGATARLDSGSLVGAFATGSLLGMVWSPCSGPMLAGALTLVASEGGAWRGTLILGVFGLGAAVVLVAAAYASRAGFGVLLLALGLGILTGADKRLEAWLIQWMPAAWIDLTTRF
jgi:cytochrome c biogenesis protein CcdA